MIPGVKVGTRKGGHSDNRRDIIVVSNSELEEGDINPGQVKVLVTNQKEVWLGGEEGHYHLYSETYTAVTHPVMFYLDNIEDGSQQVILLTKGKRITIPPHVAHKVFISDEGAILVGVTEQPYTGPNQDIPFKVRTDQHDTLN